MQNDEMLERGRLILDELVGMLEIIGKVPPDVKFDTYRSYLHGQVYAMAKSLRLFFPGPGNLGEEASLALRPLLTEHRCECTD